MAARNQAYDTSSTLKQNNGVAALEAALDPVAAAKLAKLRHVSDDMPGITRHKARNGFDYRLPDGQLVRDLDALKRIRSLAIPPAWTAVWICPYPNGHIQATGRDKRGRKQYRYHPRWREVRDESKYGKMLAFGRVLPAIRERVEADLRRRGLPRERVLAAVVRLMETTLFRIGNTEYAKANKSYGLTTLRDRHVEIDGSRIHLNFRGKHGIRHETDINDGRLARIVKDCRDLPGYELFQYLDEGSQRHAIGSADVNDYLREISGSDFTAKDFRTWNGTVLAVRYLKISESPTSATAGKRLVSGAIKNVAQQLGNTPAVCRKAYVHPVVLNAYLEGSLEPEAARSKPSDGLTDEEQCVLGLLEAA